MMWKDFKEFLSHYKSVLTKLFIILFFVFLAIQYKTLGERSNIHALNIMIKNGMVHNICIAHSQHLYIDQKGVYVTVKKQKIYIHDKYADLRPRDNLYLAIVMDSRNRSVYEIDGLNAEFLVGKDKEGCEYY